MAWDEDAHAGLRDAAIDLVAYLPDSVVAPVIDRVEADEEITAVRVAREEEAVALVSGAWLGGSRGAVICQSSGLANCFNALGSHLLPAGIPFVGLVTRRGDLGEHNLAQIPAGYGMPRLLDALGVRNRSLNAGADVRENVAMAGETCFSTGSSYVLLLETSLTGGK